jgi:Zn-dependent membrane protease YugP
MTFDVFFWIFGSALLVALWGGWKTFVARREGRRAAAKSGRSGADAAAQLLERAGVHGVDIELSEGYLSNYYVAHEKTVRLSIETYAEPTLYALGMAAHEVGHALQHAERSRFLDVRNLLAPWAGIAGNASWIVLGVGLLVQVPQLVFIALAFFSLNLVLQLVNLSFESAASRRGRKALLDAGLIHVDEDAIVGRVLNAAAWAPVAALLTSLFMVPHFLPRFGKLSANGQR